MLAMGALLSRLAETIPHKVRQDTPHCGDDGTQSDHEKHLQRNKEVAAAREGAADPRNVGAAGAATPSAEVAALYRHQDLSLKAGETLK